MDRNNIILLTNAKEPVCTFTVAAIVYGKNLP